MVEERKKALTDLSEEQLVAELAQMGQPRFRADQIWRWLYGSLVESIDEMRNLPAALRAQLTARWTVGNVRPMRVLRSADGRTEKVLLELADGQTVESVSMDYEGRQTVCVSSQVGCAIRCAFCATGLGGWQRNLSAGEIVQQVLHFGRRLRAAGKAVSNVVFMGMGEPFLNYDALRQSIQTLNDARGFNLGARRMTVSTAGIVPGIRRLASEGWEIGLAVSLHAPTDALRDRLVPINQKYPLAELMRACHEYVAATHRRVTFEYALIEDVNDGPQQADELADLLWGLLCHVNIIPVNPVAELPYRPSPNDRVLTFERRLRELGVNATLRISRGADILAGCGQLRSAPAECHTIEQP
jgi:23S rRNA (adenine2503-C2)-methyltransferase